MTRSTRVRHVTPRWLAAALFAVTATALTPVALTPAADAAWQTGGAGTAHGRAGQLAQVGGVTTSAVCVDKNKARLTVSWQAVAPAAAYQVRASTSPTFPAGSTVTAAPTAPTVTVDLIITVSHKDPTPIHASVRATRAGWVGPQGLTVSVTVPECKN